MSEAQRNWAGNLTFHAARWHVPETIDEARAIVAQAHQIRAIGTRHSFNAIADSDADILSTARLNRILHLDRERRTVTVEAGVRYGDLGAFLHAEGFALHNMASLPHISVAGAISTATHGSGDRNGNLATVVSGLELITATGDIVSLRREKDGDLFAGAVVGLGALGIVAKVQLDVAPTFSVAQRVYENLPFAAVENNFDAITSSAHSVSLFTRWLGDDIDQVWVKSLAEGGAASPAADFFGAKAATENRHPIITVSAESCTAQLGVAGPWHERLPHFRPDFTPSKGDELQSEYFVARKHAVAALNVIAGLRGRIAPLLQVSEIRTIAADDLWMSPSYQQDSVGIHFTWKPDWPAVKELLAMIEAALASFDARPHWGKLFLMDAQRIRPLYARLPDFEALCEKYDPSGKFNNEFLTAVLGDAPE